MTKHSYECLSRTSYQLIIWAFGFAFGIHIIWSSGLFILTSVHRQMSEEEYKEVRDGD